MAFGKISVFSKPLSNTNKKRDTRTDREIMRNIEEGVKWSVFLSGYAASAASLAFIIVFSESEILKKILD